MTARELGPGDPDRDTSVRPLVSQDERDGIRAGYPECDCCGRQAPCAGVMIPFGPGVPCDTYSCCLCCGDGYPCDECEAEHDREEAGL